MTCRNTITSGAEARYASAMGDMKLPIGDGAGGEGHFLLDLDASTLPAYELVSEENGRAFWGVWCKHCADWHWHGPGEGHRIAHCHDENSPYELHGYNLALAGKWEELPIEGRERRGW